MLNKFIVKHRREITQRCIKTLGSQAGNVEIAILTAPLDAIIEAVRLGIVHDGSAEDLLAGKQVIKRGVAEHGEHRAVHHFDIAQVARDYGVVCDSISALARDLILEIPTEDFRLMNLAIDEGIASALRCFDASHKAQQRRASAHTIGSFAHELRNALAGATLAHDLLKSGQVDFHGKTSNVLERSLTRMERMISQLVTRITLDAAPQMKLEALLLNDLIDESIDRVIGSRRNRVVVEWLRDHRTAKELPQQSLRVQADRELAVSALSNVIQNALKYSEADKNVAVRIRLAECDQEVVVEVEDYGPGICPEAQTILFEPFVRGNNGSKSGLGLGLAIVRHAIEAQGGTLTLRSVSNQGSVFGIHFRMAPTTEHGNSQVKEGSTNQLA